MKICIFFQPNRIITILLSAIPCTFFLNYLSPAHLYIGYTLSRVREHSTLFCYENFAIILFFDPYITSLPLIFYKNEEAFRSELYGNLNPVRILMRETLFSGKYFLDNCNRHLLMVTNNKSLFIIEN